MPGVFALLARLPFAVLRQRNLCVRLENAARFLAVHASSYNTQSSSAMLKPFAAFSALAFTSALLLSGCQTPPPKPPKKPYIVKYQEAVDPVHVRDVSMYDRHANRGGAAVRDHDPQEPVLWQGHYIGEINPDALADNDKKNASTAAPTPPGKDASVYSQTPKGADASVYAQKTPKGADASVYNTER